MSSFMIPADAVRFEQDIKRSQFICFLAHSASVGEAQAYIDGIREKHISASHVCWAFIAGEPGNTIETNCSDDREPRGSAGKPMLNVLEHSGIGEIASVVVRHYGGVKLGVGGLVRAYSSSVSGALEILTTVEKVAYENLHFRLPYALEDVCRRLLAKHAGKIASIEYVEHIEISCEVPQSELQDFIATLSDISRGQVCFSNPLETVDQGRTRTGDV